MKTPTGAKLIDAGCWMTLITVMSYCFFMGSFLEGVLAFLTFMCGAISFSIFSHYRGGDE